ncbi:hypothetical protein JCM16303_006654 [Sporobolomyces ruberrimus]
MALNQSYRHQAAFNLSIDYISLMNVWHFEQSPTLRVYFYDTYKTMGPPWTCTFTVVINKEKKFFHATGSSKKAAKNGELSACALIPFLTDKATANR